MFSWKSNNYLLVVDCMSSYIFVENLQKSAKCKTVTEKFHLLTLTYGFPCQVRYDKGPQFGQEFEILLMDINVEPQLSSANNSCSKILLHKSIFALRTADLARPFEQGLLALDG